MSLIRVSTFETSVLFVIFVSLISLPAFCEDSKADSCASSGLTKINQCTAETARKNGLKYEYNNCSVDIKTTSGFDEKKFNKQVSTCLDKQDNDDSEKEEKQECKELKKDLAEARKDFASKASSAGLSCDISDASKDGTCATLIEDCQAGDVDECSSLKGQGAKEAKEQYDDAFEALNDFQEKSQEQQTDFESASRKLQNQIEKLKLKLLSIRKKKADADRAYLDALRKNGLEVAAKKEELKLEIENLGYELILLKSEEANRLADLKKEEIDAKSVCWAKAYKEMQDKRNQKLARRRAGRARVMTAGAFFKKFSGSLKKTYSSWVRKSYEHCLTTDEYTSRVKKFKLEYQKIREDVAAKQEIIRKKRESLKRQKNINEQAARNKIAELNQKLISTKEDLDLQQADTLQDIEIATEELNSISKQKTQASNNQIQKQMKLQADLMLAQTQYGNLGADVYNTTDKYATTSRIDIEPNAVNEAVFSFDFFQEAQEDYDDTCIKDTGDGNSGSPFATD